MSREETELTALGLEVAVPVKGPVLLLPLDFEAGKALRAQELICPLDSESLFLGARYSLLSSSEDYERHIRINQEMTDKKLNSPEAILANPRKVRETLRDAAYRKQKERTLVGLAEWWMSSDWPERLLEDVQSGRVNEFGLRNELAHKKNAPGLAMKCSSFLMSKCGYDNVSILDIWALRFLDSYDVELKMPDRIKISGPTGKEYLRLEQKFIEIATDLGTNAANLHTTVWAKMSGYHPGQRKLALERAAAGRNQPDLFPPQFPLI